MKLAQYGDLVIAACLAANIPALSAIPATVLGYSATFAYVLQTPGILSTNVLLSASWENPVIIVSVSLVLGVAFGIVSAKLAAKMTTIEE
jgi:ABC-type antimicrobial peptide transport system permease subunit